MTTKEYRYDSIEDIDHRSGSRDDRWRDQLCVRADHRQQLDPSDARSAGGRAVAESDGRPEFHLAVDLDFDLAFNEHALEQHATVERLERGTELDRHQLDAVERARTEGRPQLIAVQSEYREIRRSDR